MRHAVLPPPAQLTDCLVDPLPAPVAFEDPGHRDDLGTENCRCEDQAASHCDRQRDLPGRVHVLPPGGCLAPPAPRRGERAYSSAEGERRHEQAEHNLRSNRPVTLLKMLPNMIGLPAEVVYGQAIVVAARGHGERLTGK